jgi:hypothetical protein
VLYPFFGQRLFSVLPLEDPAQPRNGMPCHGFDRNAIRRELHDRTSFVLNLKLAPKPSWNDDLSLSCKPDGISAAHWRPANGRRGERPTISRLAGFAAEDTLHFADDLFVSGYHCGLLLVHVGEVKLHGRSEPSEVATRQADRCKRGGEKAIL